MLQARAVPYRIIRQGALEHIYVPALYEQMAMAELAAFARERKPAPKIPYWPLHHSWPLAPLYMLPLLWLHGAMTGWWQAPGFLPSGRMWEKLGSLDSIRILLHGEWERLATALTLHTGLVHLTGNICFGAFFLCLLARLCGTGHAWLLTFLGGVLGNGLSLIVHDLGYASIGFSTALFAAVGAIAGILLWRTHERIFMPIAAALALLSLLGVEGANTDYVAHVCGLVSGCFLGFFEGFCIRRNLPLLPQSLAALLALALPCGAWLVRFRIIHPAFA